MGAEDDGAEGKGDEGEGDEEDRGGMHFHHGEGLQQPWEDHQHVGASHHAASSLVRAGGAGGDIVAVFPLGPRHSSGLVLPTSLSDEHDV